MVRLTLEEQHRYNRQIIVPEISETGQEKLKSSKIFIAGCGGLGSASAYYLAAAGIGKLAIADKDFVEIGNLNRQILHRTSDIGKAKTLSAKEKLTDLNPNCQIMSIPEEVSHHNICDLVCDSNLIIDAVDNLQARKILNRCAIKKKIPLIFGGIDGFSGMVTTIIPGKTACLECIFPDDRTLPEKRITGALGPVAGVIASIQATEAIKIILGIDKLLTNRLLIFRGLESSFREITIEQEAGCALCGSPKV